MVCYLLFERFVLKATKQIVHNWLNATSTWTKCQYVRYIPLCARPICVSVCRTIRRLRTKLRMLCRIKSRWDTKHVNHKKSFYLPYIDEDMMYGLDSDYPANWNDYYSERASLPAPKLILICIKWKVTNLDKKCRNHFTMFSLNFNYCITVIN